MTTIAEFIAARLDEDEQTARAAFDGRGDNGVWERDQDPYANATVFSDFIHIYPEGGHSPEQAEHIARQCPATTLRWCTMISRLTAAASAVLADNYSPDAGILATGALADIAAYWHQHPDYQEAWKP